MSQACSATLCSSDLFIYFHVVSPELQKVPDLSQFQGFTSNARLIRRRPTNPLHKTARVALSLQPPAKKDWGLETDRVTPCQPIPFGTDKKQVSVVWSSCLGRLPLILAYVPLVASQGVDFHPLEVRDTHCKGKGAYG